MFFIIPGICVFWTTSMGMRSSIWLLYSLPAFRVDHFVVVLGDLLVQALRAVGKEITMLMHGAPLHRQAIPNGGDRALEPRAAIDDEELGPLQAAPDEAKDECVPRTACETPTKEEGPLR